MVQSLCAAATPDGNTLVYPTRGSTQLVVQTVDGNEPSELLNQTEEVTCAAISSKGQLLTVAATSGLVRIWDLGSRKRQCTLRESSVGRIGKGLRVVAFSPDDTLLAVGTDLGVVEVWNVDQQKLQFSLTATTCFAPGDRPGQQSAEAESPDRKNVFSIDFSLDGALLAAGLDDCTVRLWNLNSREEQILSGHSGQVFCVAFSPNRKELVGVWQSR